MNWKTRIFLGAGAVCGLGLLLVPLRSVYAHHAFGAEFDPNRPVLLKGPVTRVEWINPHTWIHLEVTREDGKKEIWMVEGGTPNSLLRRGLKRDTIQPGKPIIVDGYQAKDGARRSTTEIVADSMILLGDRDTRPSDAAPSKQRLVRDDVDLEEAEEE